MTEVRNKNSTSHAVRVAVENGVERYYSLRGGVWIGSGRGAPASTA